jgi:8-oxo-dGTP pyrophosphatase MutT (NUDIX family)
MVERVRAAGCVVWRVSQTGTVEVLVVHRDRYDDWSFPKGKLEAGETELECALREVEEETNLKGEVGAELPSVEYVDHKGRDKIVRYWLLRHLSGQFVVNDEVDQVRWVSPSQAVEVLSYRHDIALVGATQQDPTVRAAVGDAGRS